MADNNQFVQGKKSYSLTGNGVSSSAVTVTVSDFTLPDGTPITMSMFGDTGYATHEPGTTREENISFTGVIQNANNTATLTGVTKGLGFVAPYTGDSSRSYGHGGNTPLVLSNSAPFYNELSGKDNDETITGTWTYTAPNYPRIDDALNPPTQDEQFAPKKYVDDKAFAGANLNKVVVDAIAGETIAENDIVYFDETDNEWRLAAATFVDQANYLVGLAMGAGTNGNAIDGGVMTQGIKTGFTGLTAGEPYFMSDTNGEISLSVGTITFELGYAQSATQLYFFPKFKSFLTKDQKDALAGTSGTPSDTNRYVTDDDTATTSTADAVVRGNSDGKIDGSWLNGTQREINAGETISGATLPVAVCQKRSDGEVYACDGDDITLVNFLGFAVTDSTDGNPITVQTDGVVGGFTGLTAGAYYYVQADKTLGPAPDTFSIRVGKAISATEIRIETENPTLVERGLLGEGQLVTTLGKDFIAENTAGSGGTTVTRKTSIVSSNSSASDDGGRIYGNGIELGDTSTESNLSYDKGFEFQTAVSISGTTGNLNNLQIIQFIGAPPVAAYNDTNHTPTQTAKHVGFVWFNNISQTAWVLSTTNADGTTQTINTASGYTDPTIERIYRIEYDFTAIRYFIDGVLVATHTTNLPTGAFTENKHGVYTFSESDGSSGRWNSFTVQKQLSYSVASFN